VINFAEQIRNNKTIFVGAGLKPAPTIKKTLGKVSPKKEIEFPK
jgi:hypothetical protein